MVYIYTYPSHLLCSPFCSLPPSRNSDPGSHSRLFCPPPPLRFVPCIFIARRFQLFIPSSTHVELCLPTLGALSSSSFFFPPFFIFANKFKISPRRGSNSRTNTSSIRGLPLVHRGDRLYVYTSISPPNFTLQTSAVRPQNNARRGPSSR